MKSPDQEFVQIVSTNVSAVLTSDKSLTLNVDLTKPVGLTAKGFDSYAKIGKAEILKIENNTVTPTGIQIQLFVYDMNKKKEG